MRCLRNPIEQKDSMGQGSLLSLLKYKPWLDNSRGVFLLLYHPAPETQLQTYCGSFAGA